MFHSHLLWNFQALLYKAHRGTYTPKRQDISLRTHHPTPPPPFGPKSPTPKGQKLIEIQSNRDAWIVRHGRRVALRAPGHQPDASDPAEAAGNPALCEPQKEGQRGVHCEYRGPAGRAAGAAVHDQQMGCVTPSFFTFVTFWVIFNFPSPRSL